MPAGRLSRCSRPTSRSCSSTCTSCVTGSWPRRARRPTPWSIRPRRPSATCDRRSSMSSMSSGRGASVSTVPIRRRSTRRSTTCRWTTYRRSTRSRPAGGPTRQRCGSGSRRLDDASLAAPCDAEVPSAHPRWFHLMHLYSHAIQQFSDAAVLLTAAGHSPGELDFLDFAEARRAAPDAGATGGS